MIRQYVLLLLAIGQLIFPPTLFARGFNAQQAVPPIEVAANPATPAGYAFVIWGFIYVGSLLLAICQFLPAGRVDTLLARIGWPCAIGFGLCILWLISARFGPVWLTVPIIWGMLIALSYAFVIVMRWPEPLGLTRQIMVAAPLALYVGWLSAAAFVNAADVLPGYGFDRFGLSADAFGLIVIAGAGIIAVALISQSNAYPAYVLTVIWALAAIIVRNGNPLAGNSVSLAATIAVVTLLAVATLFWTGALRMSPATRLHA